MNYLNVSACLIVLVACGQDPEAPASDVCENIPVEPSLAYCTVVSTTLSNDSELLGDLDRVVQRDEFGLVSSIELDGIVTVETERDSRGRTTLERDGPTTITSVWDGCLSATRDVYVDADGNVDILRTDRLVQGDTVRVSERLDEAVNPEIGYDTQSYSSVWVGEQIQSGEYRRDGEVTHTVDYVYEDFGSDGRRDVAIFTTISDGEVQRRTSVYDVDGNRTSYRVTVNDTLTYAEEAEYVDGLQRVLRIDQVGFADWQYEIASTYDERGRLVGEVVRSLLLGGRAEYRHDWTCSEPGDPQ